jgi:hypothetical protein
MYDCDFSVTVRGVTYTFTEVESMQIEDPERTRLIRGSNASNKVGISYKEGLKEAKTLTLTVIGMPAALHTLLKDVYEKRERLDANCISRVDGSSKIAKNSVLAQSPKQLSMDDSAESMNTGLIFETFNIEEVHKS